MRVTRQRRTQHFYTRLERRAAILFVREDAGQDEQHFVHDG